MAARHGKRGNREPRRRETPPAVHTIHDLPRDLLARPAAEGTRWLALARLHELEAVRPRLDDDHDAEALHDFRVALRRLRSVVRAYRGALADGVPRRARRRLTRLAHATSPPRDVEVHLAWVATQRARLGDPDQAAVTRLERRLLREQRTAEAVLRRELDRGFAPAARRLERRLRRYRVTRELGDSVAPPPTRAVVATTLRSLAEGARKRLRRLRAMDDPAIVHATRIATKRLRYALEPLAEPGILPPDRTRIADQAIAELRLLQDDLGQLHDAHVFGDWLAGRAAPATEPAASSLREVLRADALQSFGALAARQRRRRIGRMLRSVEHLADLIDPGADASVAGGSAPPS